MFSKNVFHKNETRLLLTCFGASVSRRDFFWGGGLIYVPIRTLPSLEIQSTPPPPGYERSFIVS